jgi:bisanhydrobacterioruberin hydratase
MEKEIKHKMARFYRIMLIIFFGIYGCLYPGSLYVLFTNQVPEGSEWMASLLLFAMGSAALMWVTVNFGLKRGFLAGLTVLFLGFLVETIGELTDFPFGAYQYTDVLAPKIGVVPIPITFAWFMIVLSSYFTARLIANSIFPQSGQGIIITLAVVLAVASDFLMEPVAFHVQNYWVWEKGGFYYGVPAVNFVAWAAVTLVMVLVFLKLTRLKTATLEKPFVYSFVPPALYLMNLFMFTGINLTQGYFGAAVIGVITLSFVASVFIVPDGSALKRSEARS